MKNPLRVSVVKFFLLACAMQALGSRFEQNMIDRTQALSTALNIPLVSNSQIWTEPLFSTSGVIITNDIQFIRKEMSQSFTIYSNEQVVAYGKLYENTSYEKVCNSLLFDIVFSNMTIEMIISGYRLLPNGVGDFRFVEVKFDEITGDLIDDLSIVHFVRGAKAISLHGKDGANVQPIAEVLDELLKKPPASQ